MGYILEEMFASRDSVVFGYAVHMSCTCCTCGVAYTSYMLCYEVVVLGYVYYVVIVS